MDGIGPQPRPDRFRVRRRRQGDDPGDLFDNVVKMKGADERNIRSRPRKQERNDRGGAQPLRSGKPPDPPVDLLDHPLFFQVLQGLGRRGGRPVGEPGELERRENRSADPLNVGQDGSSKHVSFRSLPEIGQPSAASRPISQEKPGSPCLRDLNRRQPCLNTADSRPRTNVRGPFRSWRQA